MRLSKSMALVQLQSIAVALRQTRLQYNRISSTRLLSTCGLFDRIDTRKCAPKNDQSPSRRQYSDNGPHKEYFQTPGQAPKPDLSPYDRSQPVSGSPGISQSRFQNSIPLPNSLPPTPIQTPPTGSKTHSLPRRALRSLFWAFLFCNLGLMTGTYVITWEYMSPLFEEGSEQDAELLDEIKGTVDEHSLVGSLRENQWREVDLDPATNPSIIGSLQNGASKGRSMIYQALSGTKGLVGLKMFHHATEEYSVLVFFTGFGVEGWPDVIHGGIITSMLEEGVQRHVEYFYGSSSKLDRRGETTVSVDFKMPVKPGEVYAVLIPPATRQEVQSQLGMSLGAGIGNGTDKLLIMPLLMQMGAAPVVNVSQRGNDLEYKIQIPSGGMSGEAHVHALAQVTMRVASQVSSSDVLNSIGQANAAIVGARREENED